MNQPTFLGQALQLVLRVPLNKISSVLPSWSLQPINRCSLKAYMWASLSMGETEMLPPEIPETTLGNHEQGRQQELPGGKKKKKKMDLEEIRGFGSCSPSSSHLGQNPAPSRSLANICPPSAQVHSPPRGHQSAFLQCVVSGFRQIFTGLID